MKRMSTSLFLMWFCLVLTEGVLAGSSKLEELGNKYFQLMKTAASPGADQQDLNNYLALMSNDVGFTHIPWRVDSKRYPDGKYRLKESMSFYLGSNTEFNAELLDMFLFNETAIAIRYKSSAKGIHPTTDKPTGYSMIMMEVLEVEDGKISMIRKYHE